MPFFFDTISKKHLLVVGESGIDEYLWGDVRRISPEAPVPVVEVESQSAKLGLAANVAQNVASLGAKVTLLTVRGKDEEGNRLESMLKEQGISQSLFLEDAGRPTPRKVRVVAQKQHVLRVDYEKSHPLEGTLAKRFCDMIREQLTQVDGVIVQDYGKGIWSRDTMAFVWEAKEKKIPVFVDPSRTAPLARYAGVTLLTPTLKEAETLCGFPEEKGTPEVGRLRMLAERLLEGTNAEHAIITCGAMGMVSLTQETKTWCHVPTFAREVFDVTGAGDTVIAVLSLLQVCGESLERSIQVANAAAGIVVARVGTASVTQAELKHELERLDASGILRQPLVADRPTVGQRTLTPRI